jgi:hypothetical protein
VDLSLKEKEEEELLRAEAELAANMWENNVSMEGKNDQVTIDKSDDELIGLLMYAGWDGTSKQLDKQHEELANESITVNNVYEEFIDKEELGLDKHENSNSYDNNQNLLQCIDITDNKQEKSNIMTEDIVDDNNNDRLFISKQNSSVSTTVNNIDEMKINNISSVDPISTIDDDDDDDIQVFNIVSETPPISPSNNNIPIRLKNENVEDDKIFSLLLYSYGVQEEEEEEIDYTVFNCNESVNIASLLSGNHNKMPSPYNYYRNDDDDMSSLSSGTARAEKRKQDQDNCIMS